MDPLTGGAQLPPGPGLHCAVFAVDIAGFGDPRRDDRTRVHMHRAMYAILARAFADAGVPWEHVVHEDRGDGVLAVIPGAVPHATLVDPLARLLCGGLRTYNHTAAETARIRLRAALHAGQVQRDDHGLVGEAVNHTCRLLDAAVTKETLAAAASAPLAFIASGPLFDAVVRDTHADVDPDTFRQVMVEEKETRAPAWIHLPGMGPARSWPAAVGTAGTAAVAPRHAGDPAPGGQAAPTTMQGFVFHGVTHIAGDAVAGDKHVHASARPAAWVADDLPPATTAGFVDGDADDTGELNDAYRAELPDHARQALPSTETDPGPSGRSGAAPPPAGAVREATASEGGDGDERT